MTRKRNRKTSKADKSNQQTSNRMWKQAKLPPHPEEISEEDSKEVYKLFSKKLTHTRTQEYLGSTNKSVSGQVAADTKIPIVTTVEVWIGDKPCLTECKSHQDSELMRLKQEMNKVKDQLSCKDIQTWHAHTTRCNLAANIIPYVKSLEVELCTQAWVKFYEILSAFHQRGIVPDCPFLSLHLCEAPGAFVTSLNHFLQQNGFSHMWDWRATTLNPYHEGNNLGEMIADDRLIRQTYSQWFFGSDGTGDITVPGHVQELREMVESVAEDQELTVLLVSADGSKDCQENPAEQEALVSRLHYGEALTAALVIAQGGALVIKMFTLFERSSVVLVFLLNLMFEEVTWMKPATSKSGNSEVYLVCVGYRKNVKDATLWSLMDLTVYKCPEGRVINLVQPMPDVFVEEHRLFCQTFAKWQLETISANLSLFDTMDAEQTQKLESKQQLALGHFLSTTYLTGRGRHHRRVAAYLRDKSSFYFPPPPASQMPSHHQSSSSSQNPQLKYYRQSGTFELRQNLSSLPWSQRLAMMEFRDDSTPKLEQMQCKHTPEDWELDDWLEVDHGQAFTVVNSSRLCDNAMLADLNLMLNNSDYDEHRQLGQAEYIKRLGKTLTHLLVGEIGPTLSPSTSIDLKEAQPTQETSLPGPDEHFPPLLASKSSSSSSPILTTASSVLSKKVNFPPLSSSPLSNLSSSSPPPQPAATNSVWANRQNKPLKTNQCQEEEMRNSPIFQAFIMEVPDSTSIGVRSIDNGVCGFAVETQSGQQRVFCNLTSFCDAKFRCSSNNSSSRFEELKCRVKLVHHVAVVLKNLKPGSCLVLLTPTILCRLMASLLYVLARIFRSIHIDSTPNLWLHQVVTLDDYSDTVSPHLLSHLLDIGQRLEREAASGQTANCVMEVVSFPVLLSDRKFVQFVTAHNNRSMAGFLNMMLKRSKSSVDVE